MESLILDFGECMPDRTKIHPDDCHRRLANPRIEPVTYLHCGVFSCKEAVFSDMRRHGVVAEGTSSAVLRAWWLKEWWYVMIKKWQPFAKCEECLKLRTKLLSTVFPPAIHELKLQQWCHRQQVSIGRRRYDIREKLSEVMPELFLHVSIDAMDNKKTNLPQPRHFTHSKSTAGMEVLKTRVMGLYSYGRGFVGYWALPFYSQSINLTIACLQHFFHTVKGENASLPPFLFLQMDNAAKDNKNTTIFAYLSYLVRMNWFQEIYVHFLPPGHTHSNLDQKYSVISQRLKNKDIFNMHDLTSEVGELFKEMGPYTRQVVVGAIGDYKKFFEDKHFALSGHGTSKINGMNRRLHAFKITKSNGQAGETHSCS